ncbi:MAG: hypothetical protein IJA55_06280 [Clostridia bacterium]|nr:hypothetical protein [Clostridia bacterium]
MKNILMDLVTPPSPSEALSGNIGVVAAIAAVVVIAAAVAIIIRALNKKNKGTKSK